MLTMCVTECGVSECVCVCVCVCAHQVVCVSGECLTRRCVLTMCECGVWCVCPSVCVCVLTRRRCVRVCV